MKHSLYRLSLGLWMGLVISASPVWAEGNICILLNADAACPSETVVEASAIAAQVQNATQSASAPVGVGTIQETMSVEGIGTEEALPVEREMPSVESPATVEEKVPEEKTGGEEKPKAEKAAAKAQPGFKPGSASVGVDGTVSEDVQVYTLPLAYNFATWFKLSASVPYISTKDASGLGDVSLSAKFFTGLSESLAMLTSVGGKAPTGDEKVGAGKVLNYQFGQSFLWNLGASRLLGSYNYLYSPPDKDKLDQGDTLSFFLGLDTPLVVIDSTNLYAGIIDNQSQESQQDKTKLGDKATLVDATVGFVFIPWNLRMGLTIPASTTSEVIKQADRKASVDFGFRYNL